MVEWKILKLCQEYGLHSGHYEILELIKQYGSLSWDSAKAYSEFREISKRPSVLLRFLVDRELLSGPARGEKIVSAPFALTDQGSDMLGRIQRGLHTPAWLSEHKVKALELLDKPHPVAWSVLKAKGVRKVILKSLVENEYLCSYVNTWQITALGREALDEWDRAQLDSEQD